MSRFAISGLHPVFAMSELAAATAPSKLAMNPAWAVRLKSGAAADVAHVDLPKGRYRVRASVSCTATSLLHAALRASVSRTSAGIDETHAHQHANARVSAGAPFNGECLPLEVGPWIVRLHTRQRLYLTVEGTFAGLGAASLTAAGHIQVERL